MKRCLRPKYIRQFLALACLTLITGNLSLFFLPNHFSRIQDVSTQLEQSLNFPRIGLQESKELWEQNILFVDARSQQDYAKSHIKGAISIPFDNYDVAVSHSLDELITARQIIVYCAGSSCTVSEFISRKLFELGIRNIIISNVNLVQWEHAQYPLESSL